MKIFIIITIPIFHKLQGYIFKYNKHDHVFILFWFSSIL
jgi:hypothetical protein